MTVRKTFIAAALTLLFATSGNLAAQSTALGFIRIDRNPRTSAFAGAGAASVGNGAYAAFKGAATLPSLPGLGDAFASVQLWQMSNEVDKSTHLAAGTGFRFGKFGVALGGVYQKSVPLGDFTPSDYLVSLGLSYQPLEVLAVGLNVRYAGQNLAPSAKTGGISVDVSLLGKIGPEFTVSGTVAGLGPKVKGSVAEYSQPAYAGIGLAWKHALAAEHGIELMLDGEYGFDNAPAAAVGAEYAYDNLVFLRVGYRVAGKNAVIPSHLALGFGLRIQGFRADISYLTASPVLGNTLSFGVGFSF